MIILGGQDVVRPEHAVGMYRQMKHARLMIFPGGHGEYMGELTTLRPGQTDYPVVSAVESFLDGGNH